MLQLGKPPPVSPILPSLPHQAQIVAVPRPSDQRASIKVQRTKHWLPRGRSDQPSYLVVMFKPAKQFCFVAQIKARCTVSWLVAIHNTSRYPWVPFMQSHCERDPGQISGLFVAAPVFFHGPRHPDCRVPQPIRLPFAQVFQNVGCLPFCSQMDIRRFRSHCLQDHIHVTMLRESLDIDGI